MKLMLNGLRFDLHESKVLSFEKQFKKVLESITPNSQEEWISSRDKINKTENE